MEKLGRAGEGRGSGGVISELWEVRVNSPAAQKQSLIALLSFLRFPARECSCPTRKLCTLESTF